MDPDPGDIGGRAGPSPQQTAGSAQILGRFSLFMSCGCGPLAPAGSRIHPDIWQIFPIYVLWIRILAWLAKQGGPLVPTTAGFGRTVTHELNAVLEFFVVIHWQILYYFLILL